MANRSSRHSVLAGALALLACGCQAAPDDPIGDDLAWGDGKADEVASGALLEEAFDPADSLACGTAADGEGLLPGEDDATWRRLEAAGGRIVIHYRTEGPDRVVAAWLDLAPRDGHPDFVNEVARGADEAWALYHERLGYPAPAAPTPVYVRDAGEYFGYYSANTVVLDNDSLAFRISRHFLRATLAHEYFHAVQAQLIDGIWDTWFTEATAVWAEDRATGLWSGLVGGFIRDVLLNDRLQRGVSASLATNSTGLFANLGYASFLFVQFLVERYDEEIVREILTRMGDGLPSATDAADAVLRARGSSFVEEFREYTAWNYLVGSRDDGEHYSNGRAFFHGLGSTTVAASHALPVDWQQPARGPDPWAPSYVELDVPRGAARVVIDAETPEDRAWAISTLARRRGDGRWLVSHPAGARGGALTVTVEGAADLDRVVLVVQQLGPTMAGWGPLAHRYRARAE